MSGTWEGKEPASLALVLQASAAILQATVKCPSTPCPNIFRSFAGIHDMDLFWLEKNRKEREEELEEGRRRTE